MSVLTTNYLTPTGREEAWRFTPLKRLRGLHDGTSVQSDRATLIAKDALPKGVTFTRENLEPLAASDDVIIERIRSFSPSVAHLSIAANTEVSEPIFLGRAAGALDTAEFSRVRISLGTHAVATVIVENTTDTILAEDQAAKIIVMGDLNDNPSDYSVSHALQSSGGLKMIKKSDLYNPWVEMLVKGNGTLANRDAWGIFDQILVSQSWIPPRHAGKLFLGSSHIFKAFFMIEQQGRYKGYPLRTWDGNQFRDGFSDHFPTFLVLLEKIE